MSELLRGFAAGYGATMAGGCVGTLVIASSGGGSPDTSASLATSVRGRQ
jgi:hypothetical protein